MRGAVSVALAYNQVWNGVIGLSFATSSALSFIKDDLRFNWYNLGCPKLIAVCLSMILASCFLSQSKFNKPIKQGTIIFDLLSKCTLGTKWLFSYRFL